MTNTRVTTANEVRRMKFLERKADEYAAALRELGYTVISPEDKCPLCGEVNGHASICDEYWRES
jgi:rubrerythrin